MRKVRRSSKSPSSPPFHTRKVFPLVGFSVVVWPRTTPSLNDQRRVSPSQASGSLVEGGCMPAGAGGAVGLTSAAFIGAESATEKSAAKSKQDLAMTTDSG